MSGKQHTVMWLGILLITVRLFTSGQGRDIWKLLVTAPPPTSSSGGKSGQPNQYPSVPGLGTPGQGWY